MKKWFLVLALLMGSCLGMFGQIVHSVPPGLIVSSSGLISGTPTRAGVYQFYVVVCDSEMPVQCSVPFLEGITIYSALTFGKASLPFGTVGEPYNYQLQVYGGQTPYEWSVQ